MGETDETPTSVGTEPVEVETDAEETSADETSEFETPVEHPSGGDQVNDDTDGIDDAESTS